MSSLLWLLISDIIITRTILLNILTTVTVTIFTAIINTVVIVNDIVT